jgi:hypothetical protein
MGSRIKRTAAGGLLALLMVIGLATAIPASAGAAGASWYNGIVKVGASQSVEGKSDFTLKASLNGTAIKVYCATSQTGTVSNTPVVGAGKISTIGFGEYCGLEMPGAAFENCFVSLKGAGLPWTLAASFTEPGPVFALAFNGIKVELKFTTSIAVPVCPLNGKTFVAEGNLSGNWNNGAPSTVNFEEAEGITVLAGAVKVGTAKVSESIPFEDPEEKGAIKLATK